MNPNRRRLTVSQCDPVAASGAPGSAGDALSEEELKRSLERAGLTQVFAKAKMGVSVTSVTDKNLEDRESFADKDEQLLHSPEQDKVVVRSWLKDRGVEWCCKKGKKPESPNQDSFSVLVVEDQFALYGVFDGHGPWGHDVSDLAREVVVKGFIHNSERQSNPEQAFREAFECTQMFLENQTDVNVDSSGTTCTLVYHDYIKRTLTLAHVGDSRSVLIKNKGAKPSSLEVQELTTDHKPNLAKERARIENAKPPGRVVFDGYFNHRVFAMKGQYPGLNMSRAMGDVIAHREAGLTALPDTCTVDLAAEKAAGYKELSLLICTDGVWEFVSNEEAKEYTIPVPGKLPGVNVNCTERLAKESWDRWMEDSANEISDDITAVLVRL